MGKVFVQGLVILVGGIVVLALNEVLNLGLGAITFGIAMGGVLGLVSDGGPVGRVGSFVVGMVIAMALYVLQALLLNGSFLGSVVSIVIGLGLITVICAVTGGRLPLWAGLLGAALVTGAYQVSFNNAPQNLLTELPMAVTQALVPAAVGFLAAVFVADRTSGEEPAADTISDTDAGLPPAPAGVAAAPTTSTGAGTAGATNSKSEV